MAEITLLFNGQKYTAVSNVRYSFAQVTCSNHVSVFRLEDSGVSCCLLLLLEALMKYL